MNSLSSHVLDTTLGLPASGLKLALTMPNGTKIDSVTDDDGRCNDWGNQQFESGIYQLRFFTKDYLQAKHGNGFYPFVDIHFEISSQDSHYHVPLLISPFGFSTYRGS